MNNKHERHICKEEERLLIQNLHMNERRREAFSRLIVLYQEQLYWQIRRMVITHDDAADVLQNTFLKAWQSIDSFRGDSKLSTWLYSIARNESLTLLAKRSAEMEQCMDDPTDYLKKQIETDSWFDGDEAQKQLRLAIASLPDKQRQVFNLRYYDEMPYDEMSELLGTSVGALKASYHFAVEKITRYLHNSETM